MGAHGMITGQQTSRPEQRLSRLLSEELGLYVDATALRVFIRAHWSTISPLAHEIHGKDKTDG